MGGAKVLSPRSGSPTNNVVLTVALLAVLAVGSWSGSAAWTMFGGWLGVVTGAAAVYTAFAFVISASLGRPILPVGGPLVAARAPR